MNSFLFAETVSVNIFLFAETVSVYNLFLTINLMKKRELLCAKCIFSATNVDLLYELIVFKNSKSPVASNEYESNHGNDLESNEICSL